MARGAGVWPGTTRVLVHGSQRLTAGTTLANQPHMKMKDLATDDIEPCDNCPEPADFGYGDEEMYCTMCALSMCVVDVLNVLKDTVDRIKEQRKC